MDRFEENEENFGALLPFVIDDNITDVDWNGKQLWLTSITNERRCVSDIVFDDSFFHRFAQRIANVKGCQFNKLNPVLEAETEDLRISIMHESRAVTGLSCCIRKTPPFNRITSKMAVETNYCEEKLLHLLANCIKAHMNVVVCGEPKVGKTELAKYLSAFIPENERVYTIEDVLEWHYPEIKPRADCVEIQIDDDFTYSDAIKASLKQNPRWLCITETRGNEVRDLIKGFSTGVSGITTLHTDDVTKVPGRIVNMVEDDIDTIRFENNVYEFIDLAILVTIQMNRDGHRYRRISQVGFFVKDEKAHNNYCRVIYADGHFIFDTLPESVNSKFSVANVKNPYRNDRVTIELGQEKDQEAPELPTKALEEIYDSPLLGNFDE